MSPPDHLHPDSVASGIVVIPARLNSTRLPRKLLLSQTGQSLLAHTIRQAQAAVERSGGLLQRVLVACDHPTLLDVAQQMNVPAILTSESHPNGTSRIAEAVQLAALSSTPAFIVNLQGDQPELDPSALIQVASELIGNPECEMVTAAVEYQSCNWAPGTDPSVVQVSFNSKRIATNFWRTQPTSSGTNRTQTKQTASANAIESTIPKTWYHHIGVYAYRTDFLQRYVDATASAREVNESLEQLRALEMKAAIRVTLISAAQAGGQIDTPADYQAFVLRDHERRLAEP